MKTISIWEGTAVEEPSFSTLKEDIETDIVIIGGGITGITAAMLLSEAGKDVVLLEAHKIGLGTTGYSTGNLYATVDEHLSHISEKWNADVMKGVVKSRLTALKFIEDTIQRHKIDCDFKRTPFHLFAESVDDKVEGFIKKESEALKEAGLKPELTEHFNLSFEIKKGIRIPEQAQFHPLKYVRAIAGKISERCRIFENSQVMDFDEEKGYVKTSMGSVRANHIIMATHTPKGVCMVQTVLGPYREFGVAAPLKDDTCPDGIFWGMNEPKHSLRSFVDKGNRYVMVIGDKFKTGQHGDTLEYIQGLETFLKERFNIGAFKYVWGGQQYRPADGLPYIGKQSDKVYIATGFSTDGLVYGTLASLIISDEILGRSNPFASFFKADRFTPLKSAKEFIKENTDNFVEYLKDVPWNVDAETLRGIQPGQAKIIKKDSEKWAVYKDPAGENHIVSAICTHMKCAVNWNESEKSWDCPCHGSRFTIDGVVIEGPAIADLKKYKQE